MELNSEVKFGDEALKKAYHELADGKFEDKQLKEWLDRAAADLKKNAFSGIQIPKRLIPKEYQDKFGPLTNLWKYNLPNAWRLIYTIKRDEVVVLSVVLEWMDHKEYERRFGY
jgi:Txe/YoeB family toxin of Txe-Axe toxin-antitoxin module